VERWHQRLSRLPEIIQRLIAHHCSAERVLVDEPFARLMFVAGHSTEPGVGVAEFDARISLLKDALGVTALSDEQFGDALRISTPPECRETSQ
jgi:hypothetical protein